MNIIFFMQDTAAVFGAERATLDLAHGLRDAGESVHFFLIDESTRGLPGGFSGAVASAGFPVRKFPVRGRLSFRMAGEVRRAFDSAGGHVLHAVGYKANVHARLSGIRPVVTTVHGWLFRDDIKERLFRLVEWWCLRRAECVICLSHYYQDLLLRGGVRPDRLQLIPSGLRELPERHERLPFSAGSALAFGMLGRFSEEKNHDLFLRAAAEAIRQHPQIRFMIAGSGPMEKAIRARSEAMGLKQAITFSGYTDVSTYFEAVDVYVICSKIENLPYSILEAMARQRPVIGTRVGGIPDLVGDGQTGFLVESGRADQLAAAMIRFAGDPGLAVKMGERGRAKLRDEFDFGTSVNRHRELYRSLPRVR